jgi:hypothetical protein
VGDFSSSKTQNMEKTLKGIVILSTAAVILFFTLKMIVFHLLFPGERQEKISKTGFSL